MEEIIIEIGASGDDVTVEGKNIAGADCVTLTKEIEKAVGTLESRKLKPDYHRARSNTRKVGV